jgi:hypothetical protein
MNRFAIRHIRPACLKFTDRDTASLDVYMMRWMGKSSARCSELPRSGPLGSCSWTQGSLSTDPVDMYHKLDYSLISLQPGSHSYVLPFRNTTASGKSDKIKPGLKVKKSWPNYQPDVRRRQCSEGHSPNELKKRM